MIIPFQAASATHNPADELFALDFESDMFYILDSTGLPTDSASITLPGRTIVAGMGLAVDPTTGKFYASLQVDEPPEERVLAELALDFSGGTFSIIAMEIGTISDGTDDLAIDTLEFDSLGTLYGAVDGADYGSGLGQFSIYTININTALTTDVCFEHTDGDIIGPISFTDDDELLYRIYSQDSADSFFETVDIGMNVPPFFNCASTEIVDNLVDGETFHSLTFTGAEFIGATDAGQVYSFDESGLIVTNESTPDIIYGGLASFTGAPNQPPDLAAIEDESVNEGGSLTIPLSATDPDGDDITLSASGLPAFAILTDNGDGTGTIDVNPGDMDAGVYPIDVTATDDGTPNLSDTESFTLTVNEAVVPEFQEDLTDKMIKQFKKKISNWENRIDKLEYKIIKLEAKAAKAEANGNQERANWLYAKAADKQDKTEILEDFISIAKISIGAIPAEPVPVEFQDNLLPKSVDKIEHKIIKWMHKIAKLNHQAEKLEEKAEYYLEKGKVEKAEKLLDKAAAKRAKAQVFEDLNEVLIVAIAYDPSDVKLHDKHDDKHDKHDDKHDKHDDKYDKEGHS